MNQHLHVYDTRCLDPPSSLVIVLLLVGMAILNEWTASGGIAADFVVTNNNDAGTGSLRDALLNANNLPGSHEIDLSAVRGTINLSSPLPPIYQSMNIRGPGASDLTISGGDQHRVFITLQGDVTIKNLSIADGHARGGTTNAGGGGGLGAGGALFVNQGTNVTIENVEFSNNRASGGSALWSLGTHFSGGGGSGGGGGLGGNGGTGFFSGGGGGGLYGNGGEETITPGVITFTQNGGSGGGGLAGDGGRGYALGGGGGGITGNGGDARSFPPTEGQPIGGGGAGNHSQGPRLAGDGTAGSGGIGAVFIVSSQFIFLNAYAGGGGGGIGGENGGDGQIIGSAVSGGDGGDGGFGGGGGGGGTALRGAGGNYQGSGGSGGNGGIGGGGGGSGTTSQFAGLPFDITKGGDGGDFGGGGGSLSGNTSGNGGFGGGGGANLHNQGGNGGFGGGGGWGGNTAGSGGTYGGNATVGNADSRRGGTAGPGGGAALGGTVFVRQGGTLTLKNVSMSGGNVLAGTGDLNGQDGQAFANGIFLHGSTINIDAAHNQVLTISNDIGDGTSASAAGAINKIGPGTLILSGTNQFRGNTTVVDGQLFVNGVLSSPTIVQTNGRLGGSGTVGNTTVDGTIKPGNSIGTLNVNGTYTQSPGSTYEVEINSAGDSDRIAVTGNAILNGGTVDVVAAPGNYTPGQTYSILTTTGTVSGQYSGVSDNLFLFEPQLHYSTHAVQLLLHLDVDVFSSIPTTPNQQSVATHLTAIYDNTTGDLRAALDQLFNLPVDRIESALQQLSGEAIGSLTTVSFQNSSLFLRQVTDRLRPLGGGVPGGDQVASAWSNRRDSGSNLAALDLDTIVRAQDGGIEHFGWVNGFGTGGKVQGTSNSAGLNYDIAGSSVGVDRFIDDNTIVGFAGGYAGLTQTGADGTDANVNALHAILYGSSVWDDWYGIGSLGYGNYDYRTLRRITAGGATSVARADFDGNEFSTYFEAGTSLPDGWTTLQPFFGAQYVFIHRDAATETGTSPFNLSLASSTDDSFRGFLGARVIGVNSWRDMVFAGQIHARWMHEFLSDARFVNARVAALPTAPGFTAIGNSLGNEFGSVGAACSLMACKDLNFFVGYDLDFAQRLVAHTGYGGMQFAW